MTNRPTADHPVFHLARAVAFILGIVAVIAHAPVLAAVAIGLTGYAVTLWATRRSWPQAAPAAPATPGRTQR